MATVKGKGGIGALMSGMQNKAVSRFISEHVSQEVSFTDVRATLPQVAYRANSLVKVNNRRSGDFFVCSEQGLNSFIQEVLESQHTAHSFFDDMDSFVTDEVVGISALNSVEPRATEYSNEDIKFLANLLQR